MAVQNDRPALVLVQVEKIASAFNFADVLARPTHDTVQNEEDNLTAGAGDGDVMNAFSVADFDDDFWSQTVPQEEQAAALKAAEDAKAVKEPTVRAARLQQKNYSEASLAKARGGSDDDGDSDDDEAYAGGGKKGRKKDLAPRMKVRAGSCHFALSFSAPIWILHIYIHTGMERGNYFAAPS